MRISHEILLNLSQDEAQRQSHGKREETVSRVVIDTYESHGGGSISVDDGDTESFSIGDITSPAKGMYLEVDNDCQVTLNGASVIQMRKAPAPPSTSSIAAAPYAKLFVEANITSIEIAADQGADVKGNYITWGDPTP